MEKLSQHSLIQDLHCMKCSNFGSSLPPSFLHDIFEALPRGRGGKSRIVMFNVSTVNTTIFWPQSTEMSVKVNCFNVCGGGGGDVLALQQQCRNVKAQSHVLMAFFIASSLYYNDIVLYCVLFTFTFAFFSCRRCSSFNSTTLNTHRATQLQNTNIMPHNSIELSASFLEVA